MVESFRSRFAHTYRKRLPEMAMTIVDETYARVEGYGGVPREDFVAATERTLDAALGALAAGRMPRVDDFQFDVDTIRRRVRQGVRARDWVAHTAVFLKSLRDALIDFGKEDGTESAEVTATLNDLWDATNAFTEFAGVEFDRAAQEILRQDEERQREFVTGVLRSALPPAELRAGIREFGLEPESRYAAVRIRPPDAAGASDMLAALRRAEPTVAPRAMWTSLDGDVCGFTRDREPATELAEVAVGIGPLVALDALATSFGAATTALETAHRFRLRGLTRLEDLGVLPMVLAGGRPADALLERFVLAVEQSGPAGKALVDTIAAYLEHALQPGPTAKALHLHPNSLRKRLKRYEQQTGADLSSMDDLAAIWWALKRQQVETD